ncbi:MAG: hypothetical protein COV34_02175 [Candidatus Zambryskibacteria bacterium CG10_big_fil_rev_8_21_14_0_10_42_12]|uniref:Segregation and condensation protein A n=1 Tax=Candidatus Zambryskibacteria bacterium CG10_big_fil_rev_8_21_14_0_10_42_12 TaxID=1975115 RepID=A0A2H0QVU8_9BACT|nr:MAG: hypothetical protein COV34_02175 [Candidatus Zambryskibacteria bacterium CG10_big_fil_rev_8_21_14_0_10_42_12]
MSSAAYTVKTPVFEGPLELLLNLIEKRKLFVSDIALSEVADDFISYVKSHPEMPVDESSQFVLVASTLVLIKSKSLLPNMKLTSEEEQSIDDLERRLKEYERFRELSLFIKSLFGHNPMFAPEKEVPKISVFAPSSDMTLPNLSGAILSVIDNLPEPTTKDPHVTVKKVVSLEQVMDNLKHRIERALSLSFKEFTRDAKDRVHVIVSFLALLELVKQGNIEADQKDTYSDIHIETQDVGTPKYM